MPATTSSSRASRIPALPVRACRWDTSARSPSGSTPSSSRRRCPPPPHGRFHVVGGYEGDRAPDLLEAGNVALHGEKPHGDLPALRARFDVEIIPFRLSALTHAVDPVKLYEAAAAGRPIVATRMRALEPLAERGLVRLADGAEDFAAAIEASAVEAAATAPARRGVRPGEHLGCARGNPRRMARRGFIRSLRSSSSPP